MHNQLTFVITLHHSPHKNKIIRKLHLLQQNITHSA